MTELTLKQKIDSFIAYKHNLGYAYDTHEGYLRNYLKHIEELFPHLNIPDKESTDSFLDKYKSQSGGLYNAMASLREFSKYLMQIGYTNVYQIPPKQMPKLHPEPPYFFQKRKYRLFFVPAIPFVRNTLAHLEEDLFWPQSSGCFIVVDCAQKKQDCCCGRTSIFQHGTLI